RATGLVLDVAIEERAVDAPGARIARLIARAGARLYDRRRAEGVGVMDGWRRYLAIALFPFSLCGVFLTVASLSRQVQMPTGLRWRALASGTLLSPTGT